MSTKNPVSPKSTSQASTTVRGVASSSLDDREREFLDVLRRRAAERPDWNDFDTFWMGEVKRFYADRGVARADLPDTAGYRVAKDLSGRLAIAAGLARGADYRDELADLIRRRFKTRREFCEATGLSEDMLSHVLARRKHLSIEALQQALARIGCGLRITPLDASSADDRHRAVKAG